MRKSALIKFFLISLLILVSQINWIAGQEFGKTPLKECWKVEEESLKGVDFASDNVVGLYLPIYDGFIKAIDKSSGKIIWKTEIGGEIINLISDSEKVFVLSKTSISNENTVTKDSDNEISIRSLSISTGITNWQSSFPIAENKEVFLLDNPENLILLTGTGRLLIVSKLTGEKIFEKQYDLEVSSLPLLYDKSLFIGTTEKKIEVISIPDGRVIRQISVRGIPKTIFINGHDTLFAGDSAGEISATNIKSQSVNWKTWTGAEITNITKVEKGLLVSSFDNYVYLLSEKKGKRIWKRRLSGRSLGSPLIKDNVAVFSTLSGTDAVFIELNKGKVINQLIIQGENYFTYNPKGSGEMIFFPTQKGLLAYGTENACQNKN